MVAHLNKGGKADGIQCDLCGQVHTQKFEYISGMFDRIRVDSAMAKISKSPTEIDKRYLDLDICLQCWHDIQTRVLAVINKREHGDNPSKEDWTTKV